MPHGSTCGAGWEPENKKKERFYHEICMIKGSFVYDEEKREALSVVECVV